MTARRRGYSLANRHFISRGLEVGFMARRWWFTRGLAIGAVALILFHALPQDALARAGAGRSSGSRGSRALFPPSRSYSAPSLGQPSQQQRRYAPSAPRFSPSRGPFWHGLAGGLLGGLIGGMLFRGLGFAGPGLGGWGGLGLFDLILIGALLYGIYWLVVKRRRLAPAQDSTYGYNAPAQPVEPVRVTSVEVPLEETGASEELLRGIGYIQQMDPGFHLGRFREEAGDIFFRVQAAWSRREMGVVRDALTEEMFQVLQGQVNELRAQGRVNRLENVALRAIEPMEAWQEAGQDFITVRIEASLLDYTVDESSGKVVSGSTERPVKFEEYWTFTRPVGPNHWRLSAISQV